MNTLRYESMVGDYIGDVVVKLIGVARTNKPCEVTTVFNEVTLKVVATAAGCTTFEEVMKQFQEGYDKQVAEQKARRAAEDAKPENVERRKKIMGAAARAAHEANRAWCIAHGDDSQLSWDEAPEWQRSSCLKGVEGVMAGNDPRESHASWLKEKEATGWVFGPVKDPVAKTHPCCVPYEDLPEEQKMKDFIFVSVVRIVFKAGGV